MKWIVSCALVGLALLFEACWFADARQFCVTPADYGPLPLNRTVSFRARDVDWFGDCRAQLTGVSWSSSDTAIATVNDSGLVEPRSPGEVTIHASAGNRYGSLSIHVVPAIHRIEIVPGDTTVHVGQVVTFRAIAYDEDGKVVPKVPFTFWDNQDGWQNDSVGIRWRHKWQPEGYQVWSHLPAPGWVSARIIGDSAKARLVIR